MTEIPRFVAGVDPNSFLQIFERHPQVVNAYIDSIPKDGKEFEEAVDRSRYVFLMFIDGRSRKKMSAMSEAKQKLEGQRYHTLKKLFTEVSEDTNLKTRREASWYTATQNPGEFLEDWAARVERLEMLGGKYEADVLSDVVSKIRD